MSEPQTVFQKYRGKAREWLEELREPFAEEEKPFRDVIEMYLDDPSIPVKDKLVVHHFVIVNENSRHTLRPYSRSWEVVEKFTGIRLKKYGERMRRHLRPVPSPRKKGTHT